MIATLRGKVIDKKFNSIILEVNNIGYRVWMNTQKIQLHQEVFIYTHQQIKEDAHVLYGFLQYHDLVLFEQLISVKGIGCKTAIGFFTMFTAQEITNAIENSDITFLKKLPQVGMKSAQQIVLDLKGKIEVATVNDNVALKEALDVLTALGFSNSELKSFEKQLQTQTFTTSDEYVKFVLQKIGGKS